MRRGCASEALVVVRSVPYCSTYWCLDLSVSSPGWLDQWQLPKARGSRLRGPQREDQRRPAPSGFPDKPEDATTIAEMSATRMARGLAGVKACSQNRVHLKHSVTYDMSVNVTYRESVGRSDLPFESCPLCGRKPPPLCARPREAAVKNRPLLSASPA